MLCSPDILTFARMVPKPIRWIRNILWRFRKVLEVVQKCPECPETVPVCPGRSWKLLEGHGRFRKVPDSTTHSPAPLALGASHLGSPGRPRRGRRTKEGESSSRWDYRFLFWQVSGGKVWEALEGLGVQVGLPNLLGLRPRPPGHLYKGGQGGEENTQVSGAPWLSLVASCST